MGFIHVEATLFFGFTSALLYILVDHGVLTQTTRPLARQGIEVMKFEALSPNLPNEVPIQFMTI